MNTNACSSAASKSSGSRLRAMEPPRASTIGMITGIPASSGIAFGVAFVCTCSDGTAVPRRDIDPGAVPAELERLRVATDSVEDELVALQTDMRQRIGSSAALVFEAHCCLLRDPLLHEATARRCRENHLNVEAALSDTVEELVQDFAHLKDAIIRERAADLRDVSRRLLDRLMARSADVHPSPPEGSIVVTHELLPSVAAMLEGQHIRGIVTEAGATTAHAIILARSLAIPTLIHADDATKKIRTGDHLIVDAQSGRVFINPPDIVRSEYDQVAAALSAHKQVLRESLELPAVTSDGTAIKLSANIGKVADASTAALFRAASVGLYRTEFAFMVQDHFPSEDEQYEVYHKTAESFGHREIVIRVLDVGSDKMLPYFPMPSELNPSLGRRGTRLLLTQRKILLVQLRAILRLSATYPVAVLFPMIGGVDEIIEAKRIVEIAKAQLQAEHVPYDAHIRIGAMIETPAAAITARHIAGEVDILSIGTNDLVQYLLTTDRTSGDLAAYYEPLHPAVIWTLKSLLDLSRTAIREVSICGEIASNPAFTALLLGLGARSFSVAPSEILEVKRVIRSTNIGQATALALRVLTARTIGEVKGLLAISDAAGPTAALRQIAGNQVGMAQR